MRLFFQIFIIIFVLGSLFFLKDDLRLAYTKASSYVHATFPTVFPQVQEEGDSASGETEQTFSLRAQKVISLAQSIETPGPFRALDTFIAGQTNLNSDAVIRFTNEERASVASLPSLKENTALNLSAQKKLEDMFKGQYFEHVSPSGVGVSDLGKSVGYEYIIMGENLALGNFKDDRALVEAWMTSPGHRANILHSHYSEIGVAVGKGIFEGRTVWMAVQHFGLPKDACPSADPVLSGVIGLNKKKIALLEADLVLRRKQIESGLVYRGQTQDEQVDAYNDLVATYNALIFETKQKVSEYNTQVQTSNTCIENHTS